MSIKNENGNFAKPILQAVFLAPYLPYKLRLVAINVVSETPKRIYGELTAMNIMSLVENDTLYKPILKPISDLSLLVIEEFEKYDGKRNGKANDEIINLFCEENGVDEIIENIELKSLPYECVDFMFRNHYDFFGLIDQGLAVSVHVVE